MREITFPLINLKLHINPVAINMFGISIYWYAIIMAFAFTAGILVSKKRNGLYRNRIRHNNRFTFILNSNINNISKVVLCAI